MKYLCWWSFVLGNQVHSQQLSDAKLCLFNVNQKRAFEQIVKLLEIYNEHCVWRECRKCPFHRYWIVIIPWFLNKQTGCIAFPMNIVVVLKKLLNKQMSFLNQKSELGVNKVSSVRSSSIMIWRFQQLMTKIPLYHMTWTLVFILVLVHYTVKPLGATQFTFFVMVDILWYLLHPYLIVCDQSPMPHPRHDPEVRLPAASNLPQQMWGDHLLWGTSLTQEFWMNMWLSMYGILINRSTYKYNGYKDGSY